MRKRVILWTSLGLNALMLLAFWRSRYLPPDPATTPLPVPEETSTSIRTNVVVRRLNFVWSQVESDNYDRFIANLRHIACPESTIRDIIVADINQVFAQRRATEIHTPAHEWWRSDADPAVSEQAAAAIGALDTERRSLLSRLLGPDWESSNYPYPAPSDTSPLDGPHLGSLSPAARAAVQKEERTALARQQAYLAEARAQGQEPDPAQLARLRRLTRQSLAQWLTPEQLEEYLLRHSATANELRAELRGTAVSPDEFRALFRTYDRLEQDLAAADTAVATQPGLSLEQLREQALRQALGAERHDELKFLQDPLFQQARSVAAQAGAGEDQWVPLAAILRLTREEEDRIRTNTALSASERLEELDEARQTQLQALRQLLGEEAYERYLEKHPDLSDNPAP